jgi:hypothetical protein
VGGANDPEFRLVFKRASPISESAESSELSDISLSRAGGGGESALLAESEAESLRPCCSSSSKAGGVWIVTCFFLVDAADVAETGQCMSWSRRTYRELTAGIIVVRIEGGHGRNSDIGGTTAAKRVACHVVESMGGGMQGSLLWLK